MKLEGEGGNVLEGRGLAAANAVERRRLGCPLLHPSAACIAPRRGEDKIGSAPIDKMCEAIEKGREKSGVVAAPAYTYRLAARVQAALAVDPGGGREEPERGGAEGFTTARDR